jgi:hypothetical protein
VTGLLIALEAGVPEGAPCLAGNENRDPLREPDVSLFGRCVFVDGSLRRRTDRESNVVRGRRPEVLDD